MKTFNIQIRLVLLFLMLVAFAGCDLLEGIFTLGVGVGVLMVIIIIALLWWLITRLRK
ncbi:MAG: hypothetical protein R6U64_07885 [Bacteroidales bacterium]